MSKHLQASIRFLLTAEGGRLTAPMSGVRPHIKLGEVFTTAIVHSLTKDEVFELGRDYEVDLEILFWEEYGHLWREDAPIELFDGNRLIARGRPVPSRT